VHVGRPLAAAAGFAICILGFLFDKKQSMKAIGFQGRRGTNPRQTGLNYRGPAWASVMRTAPSIVPRDADVHLADVDLDHWGRVWTEADSNSTDLESLLTDMLAGQHRTRSGWSLISKRERSVLCRDTWQ
jgi:hypothetical protein